MRKIIFLSLALLLTFQKGMAIDASVAYSTFKSEDGNYIEVYLHLIGSTIKFAPLPTDTLKSQALVDVTLIFKKDEKIVKFDKFRLNSPVTALPVDFIDMKRYALKNGRYNLEVSFQDVYDESNKVSYDTDFKIFYSNERLQQSDIQLLSAFRKAEEGENSVFIKNGYYLESVPYNFYGKYAENLIFYNEVYNSDKAIGEDFMVSYEIEELLGESKRETVLIGHKRKKAGPINVMLQPIDIKSLPSGNYNLKVTVRNRTKALLSKKSIFFQRSNPYLNAGQEAIAEAADVEQEFVQLLSLQDLRYSLKALAPIVSSFDGEYINTLIRDENPKAMRMYLYSYWASINPNNAEAAYDSYMDVAKAVDKTYNSGFGYGFESDRGYIFMKYGKPTDVILVEDDPVAPPYEIWAYNEFPKTQQSNVKFIFYNPTYATGAFTLLHSNARGEINDPQWELRLYSEVPNELEGNNFIDGTRMQDNMGRRARRLFNDF